MTKESIVLFLHQIFNDRGDEMYGRELVTQRQHALQSATLAANETNDPTLIIAALLHDIGHILSEHDFPSDLSENLDDSHEKRAYPWLLENFGSRVADQVRLHVAAKRYLCTVDPTYAQKLSPTSLKSFLDQGGIMSDTELKQFESEPNYKDALQLRRWDDTAKNPDAQTHDLDYFMQFIKKVKF